MSSLSRMSLLAVATILVMTSAVSAQAPGKPGPDWRNHPLLKKVFQEYDRDNDGRLNAEELGRLRTDLQNGKYQLPPGIRERVVEGLGQLSGDTTTGPHEPRRNLPAQLGKKVHIERDVEYGRAGDRPLKLDLYCPKQKSEKPLPVIVYVHGGAWMSGDKSMAALRLAAIAAQGDYVCVSVGYRLSGEAIWPAQIHDCKAAIRWLRANAAKYHLDPEKIGVWGTSAGGHLVSMLGTSGDVKDLEGDCGSAGQSSRVTCVVDFCGPSDFSAIAAAPHTVVRRLLGGGSLEEIKEKLIAASPVTYVSKDDPPFLIVHGTDDNTVPIRQAEILYAALQQAGVEAVFVKLEGGGHGIDGPEVKERVMAFFDKHLRGQQVEVSAEPIKAAPPQRAAAATSQ